MYEVKSSLFHLLVKCVMLSKGTVTASCIVLSKRPLLAFFSWSRVLLNTVHCFSRESARQLYFSNSDYSTERHRERKIKKRSFIWLLKTNVI